MVFRFIRYAAFAFPAVLPSLAAYGQLTRVANTSLAFPQDAPAESSAYTGENAFGTLTFSLPIAIRNAPGQTSHLFVVQRNSGIERVNLAQNTRSTFLNLKAHLDNTSFPQRRLATDSENGILSMAFHPDYNQNGYFFVFYSITITNNSNINPQLYQRLSRFQATGTPGAYDQAATANPATELPLISQRDQAGNHNGGDIHFGADGYLYISTGDEGGGNDQYNNARFINKDFFSAILRIDVDKLPGSLAPNPHANTPAGAYIASAVHAGTYTIPPDNPFIGATSHHDQTFNASTVRTEFWTCGLRNPWRMGFDPPTGRLFVADVGQNTREEINIAAPGMDCGWSYREGNNFFISGPGGSTEPDGFNPVNPIHDYPRTDGRSVTGGVVSRGARLAELDGKYVFGDYFSGRIWALTETPGVWTRQTLYQETGDNLVAFGTDPRNGDLLYCMLLEGVVKRIVRTPSGGAQAPALLSQTGAFSNIASLTPHAGIVPYEVNLPFWSDNAFKKRWFSVPDVQDTIGWSRDANWQFPDGQVWIKHFEIDGQPGYPNDRRRLETRFLVKTGTGAYGLTYLWREDQSDADLVSSSGIELQLASGGTWQVPSRGECMTCHTAAAGRALSFNTRQLNRTEYFGAQSMNQLEALGDAGYFTQPADPVAILPRFATPEDDTQSLEIRARSYLAVNCAPCHQPGGGGGGSWDVRAHLSTEATGIIRGILNNPNGDPENRLIVPGDVIHSMAVTRMTGGGGLNRMPPIGNQLTDTVGVDLLTQWIEMDLPEWRSFTEWQIDNYGGSGVPDAAPDFDKDGDGRDNMTEYLARSNPMTPDQDPLIGIETTGAGAFEILVPRIENRSVVIETSGDMLDWQLWNVPGNAPDFPASGGGWKTFPANVDDSSRFFRAKLGVP